MCQPGKPRPHGRVPLLLAHHARRGQLPQGEVGRVALGLDVLDPARGGQLVEVEVGELGVAGEGGDVEVDAVVDDVGVPLALESLDHRDLLGDVAGGARQQVGFEAAEAPPVRLPLLCVEGRDLGRCLARLGGGQLHLVVGVVAVGDQVADVGDVGDVGDVVAGRGQHPTEEVREELAAHVPEVLWRVDGGTAGVDADRRRMQRLEGLHLAGAGVVEPHLVEPGRPSIVDHRGIMVDGPSPPEPAYEARTWTAW